LGLRSDFEEIFEASTSTEDRISEIKKNPRKLEVILSSGICRAPRRNLPEGRLDGVPIGMGSDRRRAHSREGVRKKDSLF